MPRGIDYLVKLQQIAHAKEKERRAQENAAWAELERQRQSRLVAAYRA